MKILQVHNSYLFPGGEDAVVASEAVLLRSLGHDIAEYLRSNRELSDLRRLEKIRFYLHDIYFSRRVYEEVGALIARRKPDVAHFHNSFFVIGPAAYEACFDAGIPVVQTLHNYRFLCAAATFYRDGQVCEQCLSGGNLRGILHGCWHGSHFSTWMMMRVFSEYKKRNILKRIAKFIALSEFSRRKFIDAGWDAKHIVVKSNFLERDPGIRDGVPRHVVYIGAIQPYKGVRTLLNAWTSRSWPLPLKIVGIGPLQKELQALNVPGVEWLGQKDQADVVSLLKEALCVVVPSECYENFPRVIIEAYACGVPVIASRLGALSEIVQDGKTGLLFDPADAEELGQKIERLISSADLRRELGENGRRSFNSHYSSCVSGIQFTSLYEDILMRGKYE